MAKDSEHGAAVERRLVLDVLGGNSRHLFVHNLA
jgi:hypothetical protein